MQLTDIVSLKLTKTLTDTIHRTPVLTPSIENVKTGVYLIGNYRRRTPIHVRGLWAEGIPLDWVRKKVTWNV